MCNEIVCYIANSEMQTYMNSGMAKVLIMEDEKIALIVNSKYRIFDYSPEDLEGRAVYFDWMNQDEDYYNSQIIRILGLFLPGFSVKLYTEQILQECKDVYNKVIKTELAALDLPPALVNKIRNSIKNPNWIDYNRPPMIIPHYISKITIELFAKWDRMRDDFLKAHKYSSDYECEYSGVFTLESPQFSVYT